MNKLLLSVTLAFLLVSLTTASEFKILEGHKLLLASFLLSTVANAATEYKILEDHHIRNDYSSPLPYTYISQDDLPANFSWANVNGKSYLTKSLNQHIPQYCGSCWAHGALSALADRIKIARNATGDEINLSIQFILNCGTHTAGSCHGGSHTGTYEFIQKKGFVPYDTCQPYLACSTDSSDGFCKDIDTSCSPLNTCRTCSHNGTCTAVTDFPNATIGEYGTYGIFTTDRVTKIMAEIYARGPVATGVNAEPLVEYTGGIVQDSHFFHKLVNHIVSIVGWGTFTDDTTKTQKLYWIVRNSWGQYWGEMGYFRIEAGQNSLGIESQVAWATPGQFTVACKGGNCKDDGSTTTTTQYYVDPSSTTNDKSLLRGSKELFL